MLGYLKHAALNKNRFLFDDNYRVWNVCQNLLPGKTACFMPGLYDKVSRDVSRENLLSLNRSPKKM